MKHVGLALATAISAFINAGLLMHGLVQRRVLVLASEFWSVLVRMLVANAVMVGALLLLQQPSQTWLEWNDLSRVLHLLAQCLAGGLVYLAALWVCGLKPNHFRA
jgi:putative peptidoglycan lipid II flippase